MVAGQLAGPTGVKLRDSMIRWALLILVFGLAVGADNAAHAGGFMGGCAIAWLLDRRGHRAPRESAGVGLESLLLVALVGGGFGLAGRAYQRRVAVEDAVRRGVEHGTAGRPRQAADEYRQALALDPQNAIAHFDLGLSLLRLEDWPGAAAEARAAIALDPTMADSYYVLSAALSHLDDRAGSEAAFTRFLALGGKLELTDGGAGD